MQLTFLGAAGTVTGAPRRVFVTHGESVPADTLRRIVENELEWPAHVPEYRESVQLE